MPESNWAGIPYDDLSDEQQSFLKHILDDDGNVFLHGCAGSGKTLLAAHGTRILAQREKSVQFIVYTKVLSKYVSDCFQGIGANIHEVDHYHDWQKNLEFEGDYDMAVIDECQDFETDWIEKVKAHSTNQIWLGDPNQQIYAEALEDGGFRSIFSEFKDREVELNVNYRNSISTAQLAAAFINLNEFDEITLEQKKINFIAPILKNDLQTSEANNQPNIFIEATNEEEEYDAIAKIVNDIHNNQSETWKQIAIVQLLHEDLDQMEKEFDNRDVDYFRITKDKEELPDFNEKGLTILSPIHSLKGIEIDYIIFPRTEEYKIQFWEDKTINDSLMHVLFSRARKRIFCSYTDKANSYVFNGIPNDTNKDFFEFISAGEVLNDGTPSESGEEVNKKIKNVEEEIKNYWNELDIE